MAKYSDKITLNIKFNRQFAIHHKKNGWHQRKKHANANRIKNACVAIHTPIIISEAPP